MGYREILKASINSINALLVLACGKKIGSIILKELTEDYAITEIELENGLFIQVKKYARNTGVTLEIQEVNGFYRATYLEYNNDEILRRI